MTRIRQSEELLVALKGRQAQEDRDLAKKKAKSKAAEKGRKREEVVARQEQLKGKSTQKRKRSLEVDKGISIRVTANQTPTKKANLTDKGKGKVNLVQPISYEPDSESPLRPQHGDISGAPSQLGFDQAERVEECPSNGSTGPPMKDLGFVPTSKMEGSTRKATKKPKLSCEDFIKGKGFKAERFIKANAFNPESQVIKVLMKRGLGVWMEKGKGFKQGIVRKFYTVAKKDDTLEIIIARMSSKITVKVTPDLIAKFLNIVRPSACEIKYPHANFESPGRPETMRNIYSNPTPPKDDGVTYPIGYMSPDFATMNKIIHYNLYARGSEGAPKQEEVDLLIQFMGDAVIDVASLIFEDIVLYITERSKRLMPFPQMITQLCIDQRVTSAEAYSFGEGGIFAASSSTRARAQVACSTQATQGMKSQGPSSTSAPQTDMHERTIMNMLQSIEDQLNAHDERMQTFQSRVYNDLQILQVEICRILRRQEHHWTMLHVQQDRMTQMAERFRATPFPPTPPEYFTEFGFPVPSEESSGKEAEGVVGDNADATVAGQDKEPKS